MLDKLYYTKFPIFNLKVTLNNNAIERVEFLPKDAILIYEPLVANDLAKAVMVELDQYLCNPRHKFELPLDIIGTEFQKRVWDLMLKIEPGQPLTYKEVALKLNTAPRAVGGACGRNNLPLFIPCHRVIGSNNNLCGFVQGCDPKYLAIKKWLLAHENTI